VRVVWTSSIAVDVSAPKGGIKVNDLADMPNADDSNANLNTQQAMYATSKTGNWFLAYQLRNRVGRDGIISVSQNPGNLKTNLTRHAPWMKYMAYPLLYASKMGAYTELWAGLSPDLKTEDNGCYILPWGRVYHNPRDDLLGALKVEDEGGTGEAKAFWDWCENQTSKY
jgi:NAD(P)-dependent dehydrogenase (short-subunit alcohol dehydrogenase family)